MASEASTAPSDGAASRTALALESRLALNRTLLQHVSAGDVSAVRECLKAGADAWFESDEEDGLGWSALHFAVYANSPELITLLLQRGAVWNAVDPRGWTAAQLAWSLNYAECYLLIFEEGVRHSMLMAMLNADDDEEERDTDEVDAESGAVTIRPEGNEIANSNAKFLDSRLVYITDEDGKERCLDGDSNMVMAAWESDIMDKTAQLLCQDLKPGFSVLNIGFGLGIVDTFFQSYKPGRHVIVEPHPDAISYLRSKGWDKLPGVEIFETKWEDAILDPSLGTFDVVYFDTYSQDYKDLRSFFDEVPALLSGPESRFSFFHGLAGTNSFFYDVYTRISELDLASIGLSTTWTAVHPQLTEEVWRGIKREYWSLPRFLIPISQMN
ncbi:Arginine N-methyltransferase 2 [Tilletia horrida]|nr:Arginine N-methyltransferase 2 [Tilletia horrida]